MANPYERFQARLSYPVNLRIRIFNSGVLADPIEFEAIEIWRGGEGAENGGVLVDVVDPIHIIQDSVGQYRIIWDPYLEGTSPETSPGVQGPGSPGQGTSPSDPSNIIPQVRYFDIWRWRFATGQPSTKSVGLSFFLYPDYQFSDSGFDKFRYEMKPDRKRIVKGEDLDVRLLIIPIPLYRARREPIVEYLLPISQMRARMVDGQNNEVVPWTDLVFTGQDGILPTSLFSSLQLGEYLLQAELILPNGSVIRYPKLSLMLID